jgi:hypothetical protein
LNAQGVSAYLLGGQVHVDQLMFMIYENKL